ncbi:hypothetical protein ACOTTU_11070 [Roseobacter sp. EG26]|uniref:hypothetical protein n=1 Tax=Roseobacter sp. EG26 TaxID=3412477 RepID=UPI003CE4E988
MKTARPRQPAIAPDHAAQPIQAHSRAPASGTLAALQLTADQSPAVSALQTLQRRASAVIQREGEDLPAPVPAILSMDGDKIGSVYFDDGRIRTTHVAGPEDERGGHGMIERYNIDIALAEATHAAEVKAGTHDGLDDFNEWASVRLWNSDTHPWVIAKLPNAEDMVAGPAPAGTILFENFGSADGAYEGYHPSRGAAVKEMMAPSDIAALEVAIAAVGDGNASKKNRDFFKKLLEESPELAARMRLPEEIDAQEAEWCHEDAQEGVRVLDIVLGIDATTISPDEDADNVGYARRASQAVVNAGVEATVAVTHARDKSYRSDIQAAAGIEIRAANAAARAAKSEENAKALIPTARQKLAAILEARRPAVTTV